MNHVWIDFPGKTKDVNVKIFNMITRIHEVKTLVEQIPGNSKFKFNSRTCNSDQKWDNKSCQYSVKVIVRARNIIFGILANVFVRMASI